MLSLTRSRIIGRKVFTRRGLSQRKNSIMR